MLRYLLVTSISQTIGYMVPKPCPKKLIRVGGHEDGAYLIPDDIEGIESCFSPGVYNFKNFEDELTIKYGIKCHMCDFTSDPKKFLTPLIDGMQTFEKKWLDTTGNDDSISLKDWLNKYSPDPTKDLMLQIDIEGAEYPNLLPADEAVINRFRIIVIEMHHLQAFKDPEQLSVQVGPLLEKFDRTHICVHAHPNNCRKDFIDHETGLNIPPLIELTYLRRDRFFGNESSFIQPQIPHPLDIAYNVRSLPPIHLNENWLKNQSRSLESEIKILQDTLDYANWSRMNNSSDKIISDLGHIQQSSVANLYQLITQNKSSPHLHPANRFLHGRELALGKKFVVSAAYTGFPLQGTVKDDPVFFFHTAENFNQSITIDLEEPQELHFLAIKNRTDICQDRARILFCIIHNTKDYSKHAALPVNVNDDFLKPHGSESITPLFNMKGRYITIFSPLHTALHFSSIKVY